MPGAFTSAASRRRMQPSKSRSMSTSSKKTTSITNTSNRTLSSNTSSNMMGSKNTMGINRRPQLKKNGPLNLNVFAHMFPHRDDWDNWQKMQFVVNRLSANEMARAQNRITRRIQNARTNDAIISIVADIVRRGTAIENGVINAIQRKLKDLGSKLTLTREKVNQMRNIDTQKINNYRKR